MVIVVGSVNVDLTIKVATLPQPGETVAGGTFSQSPGGKGGNQAAAAAALGAETSFVGVVGDDAFGRSARADLEVAGVDVSELRTGRRHTGVAEIMVDAGGENAIAVASGANHELSARMVDESLERIARPGAVVLCNLEIPDEAVLAAATGARRRGCRFVLNPAPARAVPDDLLRFCDVLTPNEHEAAILGSGSLETLLDRGASAVIVTKGGAGADVLRRHAPAHHQDAFPVDVVDTTGAGDAFSAAVATGLSEGRPIERVVALACAAGALSTRAVGARASLPTRAEIEELVGD